MQFQMQDFRESWFNDTGSRYVLYQNIALFDDSAFDGFLMLLIIN